MVITGFEEGRKIGGAVAVDVERGDARYDCS